MLKAFDTAQNLVSGVTASDVTNTTSTEVIAAAGVGKQVYITHVLVTNGHATQSTRVDILNGATVKWTGFAKFDGGGYACDFSSAPLRGAANTAWNVQCGTTGAQVRCSLAGFKAAY